MDLMYAPRRAGKTSAALERLLHDPEALLVVVDRQRRIHTVRTAEALYRDQLEAAAWASFVQRIVTLDQLRDLHGAARYERLLVDDAETVLQQLLRYPAALTFMTVSS